MLDVLHYYFETECVGEKETLDAKKRMRRTLYGQLYGRTYRWGDDVGGEAEFGTQSADTHYANATAANRGVSGGPAITHKPYIPPTPVNADAHNPYGTVLDAPLG